MGGGAIGGADPERAVEDHDDRDAGSAEYLGDRPERGRSFDLRERDAELDAGDDQETAREQEDRAAEQDAVPVGLREELGHCGGLEVRGSGGPEMRDPQAADDRAETEQRRGPLA